MKQEAPTSDSRGFAESLLGTAFFEDPITKKFLQLPATTRMVLGTALFAALLFIPYLGAVGLWDCWEPHYGEAARQMVYRGDWVYPYWENGWFYSKPVMSFWMAAVGMSLVGAVDPTGTGSTASGSLLLTVLLLGVVVATGGFAFWARRHSRNAAWFAGGVSALFVVVLLLRFISGSFVATAMGASFDQAPGAMGLWTEWGLRLPFAALSITAVALMSLAVSRIVSVRAGIATAFVMATMPLYFLLSRQAVTDTPFVASFVSAMACAMIGQLDPSTKRRTAWWYAFYVFCAVAMLAKGIVGVGFPAVILLLYAAIAVVPYDGNSLKRHVDWVLHHALIPLGVGIVVGAVVGFGSYLLMVNAYSGRVPDQILVRAICGGLIGFNAGLLAFAITIRRFTPAEGTMPVLWAQFFRMRLGTGIVLFFAIALPWYLTMTLFEQVGNAEEGQLFWYRFFVHDHVNRLLAGVHTTTPGGNFTYFIEQGGFALFPWIALVPGAIALTTRIKVRGGSGADQLALIAALWTAFTFVLLSSSSTKFHHYVFPILPGVAILIALYIDKLWEEGIAKNAVVLIFGLALLILVAKDLASNPKNFTDLFVYNYDRPYPQEMVNKPLMLAGRMLWWGDLAALVLVALGGYLTWDAFMDKTRPVFARGFSLLMLLAGGALLLFVWLRASGRPTSPSLLLGLAILFGALYFGYEASRRKAEELTLWLTCAAVAAPGAVLLVRGARLEDVGRDSLIPRLLATVNTKEALGFAFTVAILLLVVAAAMRARTFLFGTFAASALALALWFNWSHWVDLSHHWTQRDLFNTYYRERQPEEPITAFLMNWRGETFYSQNRVKQIKNNAHMLQYANLPGRKWALVEHHRLGILKNAVGPGHSVTTKTTAESNNKFVLVVID